MKIAIIGAGPSGIFSAIYASKNPNHQIFIFDKNAMIGRKLSISGGGRCNITTGISEFKDILSNYPRGQKILKYALRVFGPKECIQFFKERGLKLKLEPDMRIFPESNKSADIIKILEKELSKKNIKLCLKHDILKISSVSGKFLVESQDKKYEFDAVVIASGSKAYSYTGSNGDSYKFIKALGHTLTDLRPSLSALSGDDFYIENLSKFSGLSFKNVVIKAKKKHFKGDFLFTHKGLTGPLIFKISSFFAFSEISKDNPFDLKIDFIPNIDYDLLKKNLNINDKRAFLKSYLPKKFLNYLLEHYKTLNTIVENIKNFSFRAVKLSPGSEFVIAGGIKTNEINIKTLESKLVNRLYFAGEILDIDGYTGGFNIQSAISTGVIVGKSLLEK